MSGKRKSKPSASSKQAAAQQATQPPGKMVYLYAPDPQTGAVFYSANPEEERHNIEMFKTGRDYERDKLTDAAQALLSAATGQPLTAPVESITDDEFTVLRALNKATPRLVDVLDLSTSTRIGPKTCGKILNSLIERGYAERPRGKRKGATITSRGKALLNSEIGGGQVTA
jgi:hypothetical protein